MSSKRKPARNTRRGRGRRANRERPTAPYRNGDTASVRVFLPTCESARAHTFSTTYEAGPRRRFGFRANASGAPPPAQPDDATGRAPGTGPASAERGAS